jgi:hypothetical protein
MGMTVPSQSGGKISSKKEDIPLAHTLGLRLEGELLKFAMRGNALETTSVF